MRPDIRTGQGISARRSAEREFNLELRHIEGRARRVELKRTEYVVVFESARTIAVLLWSAVTPNDSGSDRRWVHIANMDQRDFAAGFQGRRTLYIGRILLPTFKGKAGTGVGPEISARARDAATHAG